MNFLLSRLGYGMPYGDKQSNILKLTSYSWDTLLLIQNLESASVGRMGDPENK
jgi:hypothetical protein